MANITNAGRIAETCLAKLQLALGPGMAVRLDPRAEHLNIGPNPHLRLNVETRPRIATRNQALHLILQLQTMAGEVIIFTEWVPDLVADEFRKAGIFFADAQGNAFIRKPPQVVLDIRGKKPDRTPKAEPGKLIEPTGLKIIHYLLTYPQGAGNALRVIAEEAGVALGTAHAVMKELQRGQWLLPAAGDKRRFGDFKGLVELFVRGYALKLRPACVIARYKHKLRAPHEIIDKFAERLKGMEGHWAVTGGMAARQMTQYLEPDNVTLFIDEQARAMLKDEPLLRDDANGNVILLNLFGHAAIAERPHNPWPLTTPLLVYAELLEAGGARDTETAKMIYDQFIEPTIPHGK